MAEGLRRMKEGRERCVSLGSLEEMWKRKRKESEEQGFNQSKKTPRSPSEAKKEEGRKEGGIMGRKEMEEVIRGVMRMELREWKEEMRKMKEEVRVGWEEVKREMREAREKERS